MATDEQFKKVLEEVAHLRRIVRNSHRMGTVSKVENGRHRVKFQDADTGDSDAEDSPWIRSGHGGAMSEDRQYSEGETVHVFAAGGNLEHAHMVPGGFSDNQPQDGNSKKDNSTRRWRKPPEDDKQGEGGEKGGAGGSGGGKGQYEADGKNNGKKWKDDEKDHQEINTWDKRHHKIGDSEYTVTADAAEIKNGKRSMKVTKDSAVFTDGKATVTIKDGKIILDGEVYLGGQDGAKRVGIIGTKDTKADALTEDGAATKVFAK